MNVYGAVGSCPRILAVELYGGVCYTVYMIREGRVDLERLTIKSQDLN